MGSSLTLLKRTTSAGLEFPVPLDNTLVGIVLEDVLQVRLTALMGVQLLQDRRVVVNFRSEADFQEFLHRYEERSFPHPDGAGSIWVLNLSVALIYVAVRGAPFKFLDKHLTRLFRRFGKVLSVRWNEVDVGKCTGLLKGTRTLTMVMEHSVPSSLTVLGFMLR